MELETTPLRRFAARAVVASVALVVIYGLARASWLLMSSLLVLYLAVIVAIGLRGAAEALARRTPLGAGPALVIVCSLVFGLPVGAGVLLAPQLGDQLTQAEERLPELEERLDHWLSKARVRVQEATGAEPAPEAASESGATQDVMDRLQSGPASQVVGWISGFVGGVSQAVLGVVLVSVVGVYLAASPRLYERGILSLIPLRHRARAHAVMSELAGQLRAWIVAQIVAMVIVALVTTAGLAIAGVPMAILLGLLAGFLDFVPNFGPAVAAIPAVLVAAGEGKIVPVLLIYGGVQVVEGWVLRPLIERKAVDTPPALLLASQVLLGTLVGFMGLLMAPALIVMITLFVRRFYVEDTLGDTSLDDDSTEPDHSNRSASTGSSREARQAG